MTTSSVMPRGGYPAVIQRGMGIGVSGWDLAGAVAARGQLGVVSGTAVDTVVARVLQSGDPGDHVRRGLSRFPFPELSDRVLSRYFRPGGLAPGESWKLVPLYTLTPPPELQALSVVCTFTEVALAKERAAGGLIGINYLYKIKMPLLPSLYGALLAGVDFVIIGAGQPKDVPRALTGLAAGEEVSLDIDVLYADPGERWKISFSPRAVLGGPPLPIARPRFLAIVSSVDQAESLASLENAPDGYVFEGPTAGGHNAPPRGPRRLSATGEPLYGPSDELDLSALRRLEAPYWLAGSKATPQALRQAQARGAAGIQVGTAFAFCRESRLSDRFKRAILRGVLERRAKVFTHLRLRPRDSLSRWFSSRSPSRTTRSMPRAGEFVTSACCGCPSRVRTARLGIVARPSQRRRTRPSGAGRIRPRAGDVSVTLSSRTSASGKSGEARASSPSSPPVTISSSSGGSSLGRTPGAQGTSGRMGPTTCSTTSWASRAGRRRIHCRPRSAPNFNSNFNEEALYPKETSSLGSAFLLGDAALLGPPRGSSGRPESLVKTRMRGSSLFDRNARSVRIDLSRLEQVSITLTVERSPNVDEVRLDALVVAGCLALNLNAETSTSMPRLQRAGAISLSGPRLRVIEFPALEEVGFLGVGFTPAL